MNALAADPRRHVLWLWTALAFVVLAVLAVVRTDLWTYGSDTGTFAQIVASALHGMRDGVEGGTHFRYHWSPSLALLWPLLALTHSALALQLVQAAATVLCAPLLAAIARPYVGETYARRIGVLALLYPPLLALGFDEFHELGLYSPLVLAMFLAADRGRWGWFVLVALVSVGVREDACIELAVFGVVLVALARWGRRGESGLLHGDVAQPRALEWAGVGLFAAAAGALALYYLVIIPRVGAWVPSHFYDYPFAHGPIALLAAPFVHPTAFFPATVTLGRFTYVCEALVPLVLLPLFSRWSLLALPGAAIVLLANSGYVWRMGDHYAALWIPWLLIGSVAAVARLLHRHSQLAMRWWTSPVLCVLFLIAFDPMHPFHYLHPYYPSLSDARRALACVPKDASVATYDEWFSAEAAVRPRATIDRADGVQYLVYTDDTMNGVDRRVRPEIQREVARGEYRLICQFGDAVTYRRVSH